MKKYDEACSLSFDEIHLKIVGTLLLLPRYLLRICDLVLDNGLKKLLMAVRKYQVLVPSGSRSQLIRGYVVD